MRVSNVLLIAVSEARHAAEGMDGLEDRFRAACREAHQFWGSGDDDLRFNAALVATEMETADEVEKERFRQSVRLMKWASLAASGEDAGPPLSLPPDFKAVPVLGIWEETR